MDGIFTRVGASDDLAAGQSTFMVEISHPLSSGSARALLIPVPVSPQTDSLPIQKSALLPKEFFLPALFNSELDQLRELVQNTKQVLVGVESSERERSGIKTLKIGYNRVFGYYIEVSKQSESLGAQDQRHRQAARTDHSAEWYPGKAHPPR